LRSIASFVSPDLASYNFVIAAELPTMNHQRKYRVYQYLSHIAHVHAPPTSIDCKSAIVSTRVDSGTSNNAASIRSAICEQRVTAAIACTMPPSQFIAYIFPVYPARSWTAEDQMDRSLAPTSTMERGANKQSSCGIASLGGGDPVCFTFFL
jgi:hypothetical protein